MSRCFPFPPPGYEKKGRTDDVDALKKEKHREKKHKKEKKDKEKRESKDKREKDKSDGKSREKKDKKEKHRDKKEDRDKDKNRTSDEKTLPGQSEGHNGEKTSDERKLPGKPEGEKFIQKEKERYKDRSSKLGEKKVVGHISGYNGEKFSQNSYLAEDIKEKFVQELGRRVRDEERGNANQLAEKFTGTDKKRDEGMVRLVAKTTGTWAEGNYKNKDKRGDDRKLDGQGIRDEARSGNEMVQKLAGMVQISVEGMPKPLDKDVERQTEGKAKTRQKEGDDKRGDKRKEREREKKSHGKDKDRDKEKKKEEKAKEKSEHKNTEHDKFKESNKDDHTSTHNINISHLLKDSDKSADTEGNLRKRKDFETNGFLHANDIQPSKLSRPTSSSNPLTENGRILELCQTSIPSTSDRQGLANNLKADTKQHKVNGLIEAQSLPVSSTEPSLKTAQPDQIAGVTMKPPHPDLKYLSKVLTVPKIEEWSDFDDQEWLFQSCESQLKKPKVGSSGADETPQVWAEAIRIESADVYALPYVIPY